MLLKTGGKESQLWSTSEKYFHYAHHVPMQQLFCVFAFCYEKQKTDKHPRCLFEVLTPKLKSIMAATQIWTCHLPAKCHRFTGCSEMDLALFQNCVVALNNLPHQVPVKDLNTYAFVCSRPSDPERGAWLHPSFQTPSVGTEVGPTALLWPFGILQSLTHPQIKMTQGWHFLSIRYHYWT